MGFAWLLLQAAVGIFLLQVGHDYHQAARPILGLALSIVGLWLLRPAYVARFYDAPHRRRD